MISQTHHGFPSGILHRRQELGMYQLCIHTNPHDRDQVPISQVDLEDYDGIYNAVQ